jgi:FkbM family methyltransferase
MTAVPATDTVFEPDTPAERVSFDLGGREFGVTFPAGEEMRALVGAILEGREYPALQLPDGPPQVILDVGANVGAAAVYFRAAYPEARILCYEPSPENYVWLAANTRTLEGVEVFPYGLLDHDAEWPLYTGERQCARRSVIPNPATDGRHELVRLRRAATELAERGIDQVSLLKLDTEGCELPILRDLLPVLSRLDVVAAEYHSEEDRRMLDDLLSERFLLVHAQVAQLHQGRVTYLSRDIVRRHPELESARIAPLGPAAVLPDPLQAVHLRFETTHGPSGVELLLDRRRSSQRLMLASLEAGQFYQPEVSYFLANVLQQGDVVVEVGARVGYFTVIAGRAVGPSGRVYAFEPQAENYRRLRDHVTLNGLRQIQSFNIALGSAPGEMEMAVAGPEAVWDVARHGLYQERSDGRGPARVEVTVLDHVLAGVPSGQGPRLIKLDAGGMEYDILKGAMRVILGHAVPFIVCEVNRRALERAGSSETQLRGFMRLIGYRASLLKPDGSGLQPLADEEFIDAEGPFSILFHI